MNKVTVINPTPKRPLKRKTASDVVWHIATVHSSKSRKEVLETCLAAGINKDTAAVQYARWKRAWQNVGQRMKLEMRYIMDWAV